ncbi:MAG: MBL fold metallo-hydrolase [Candidatus Stahlbacteria bacterium]|nr:MBL fold metallo-hydrolase [Candidatus Stahlbacteria bacterium]
MVNIELKKKVVGTLATNCYIISSNMEHPDCPATAVKEGIIIDPGDEPEKIISAIKDISIKYILLTHNHPDHIGAVEALKHKLSRDTINRVQCGIHTLDRIKVLWANGTTFDFEFSEGEEIKFGAERLKVMHTPGHTPGSCCFIIGEQLETMSLFSGDTLFSGGYGRTDFPGGSEVELFKSIAKLLCLPPETKVYPGHGDITTIGDEKRYY